MKGNRLIATMTLLVAGLSVQLDGQANAGPYRGASFVAGRPERPMTLRSVPRSPATYAPSYGRAASGPATYGPRPNWQPTPRNVLGPNHGVRLTPEQTRVLMNNPNVRRCGVDISCRTRIVSDGPTPAAAPVNDLGDMLAREQIRDAMGLQPLSPFAPTPVRRRTQAAPVLDLGDMLAREELRGIIQTLGY